MRWLLQRLKISPNAYYNFLKNRKSSYRKQKEATLAQIINIYHEQNGVAGYRNMRVYLARKGVTLSALTVHRYMNQELKLYSIVRRKKPGHQKGVAHKIFPNKLDQNFAAQRPNEKWCTDFTYLHLTDGSKRFNCSILDLCDRSIVASITDRYITADLAIRTVKKALGSQPKLRAPLLLHSDQGSQFTSRKFVEFCQSAGITQSMSKAGYPYDNAPMERYYNTLKNEWTDLYRYRTDEELYKSVEEFAYVIYNHVRPHSYNKYKTPFQARCSAQQLKIL